MRSWRGGPRTGRPPPEGANVAYALERRWDYDAIGTVANLAARLCGEAEGGQILVSSRVVVAVEELVETEEVGALTVKGLVKPVPRFNVVRSQPPSNPI